MVVTTTKLLTVDEYLQREEQTPEKSEFIQGEIIPMAGASTNHNRLTVNLSHLLPLEVEDCRYEIFVSDMRLWIAESESYFYPDMMVIVEGPIFTDGTQMAVTNPCLIPNYFFSSLNPGMWVVGFPKLNRNLGLREDR